MIELENLHNVMAYPSNILTYVWPDSDVLNTALKAAILEKEKTADGIQVSNAGGYHTDWDFFTWNIPAGNALLERVKELTSHMAKIQGMAENSEVRLNMTGWANIIRNGNYNVVHRHPNCMWSGVYYVSTGTLDEDSLTESSRLEFQDPRPGANMITAPGLPIEKYQVEPEEGKMIMFPSYLMHFVHPFEGKGVRISIAFNVMILSE